MRGHDEVQSAPACLRVVVQLDGAVQLQRRSGGGSRRTSRRALIDAADQEDARKHPPLHVAVWSRVGQVLLMIGAGAQPHEWYGGDLSMVTHC